MERHVALSAALMLCLPTGRAGAQPATALDACTEHPEPTKSTGWGAYAEEDLGVLLLFGGVGIMAGATHGPLRAGLGFYRFDSPFAALSGAPDGFELKVEGLLQADVAWHPFSTRMDGGYMRAVGQLKRQRVENREDGVRKSLDSVLLGPELGWVLRVHRGIYLAPRVGALYYVAPPQGRDHAPVDVGGAKYDNPRHRDWDIYATLGLGIVFE